MRRWCVYMCLFVFITVMSSCGGSSTPSTGTTPTPTVTVTGPDGTAVSSFSVNSAPNTAFSGLTADTAYTVRVTDPNGTQMGDDFVVTTNEDGEVQNFTPFYPGQPSTQVDSSGILGAAAYDPLTAHWITQPVPLSQVTTGAFTATLVDSSGATVTTTTITVTNTDPVAFSSDDSGSGVNSYLKAGATVYVTIANLTAQAGNTVNVYVMPNNNQVLATGDTLVNIANGTPSAISATVGTDGSVTVAIWTGSLTQTGAYNIVVDVDGSGTFSSGDLYDGIGALVGFMVHGSVGVSGTNIVAQIAVDCNRRSVDLFDPDSTNSCNRDVRAWLNPTTRSLVRHTWVHKYVVVHQDTWADGDVLTDVSSAEVDPVQYGCTNEALLTIWPRRALTAGCFDVVIDVNNNGLFDPGIDVVDNIDNFGNTTCGFRVPNCSSGPSVTITGIFEGAGTDGAQIQSGATASAGTLTVTLAGTVGDTAATGYVSVRSLSSTASSPTISINNDAGAWQTQVSLLRSAENEITEITVVFVNATGQSCFKTVTVVYGGSVSATAGDLKVALRWVTTDTSSSFDLDLHLVAPSGTYRTSGDCYYSNCKTGSDLDWPHAAPDSDSANNPVLDIDCISEGTEPSCTTTAGGVRNSGPENITQNSPFNGTYTVLVDGFSGSGNPFVQVFFKGVAISSEITGPALLSGTSADTWKVGTITVTNGTAVFTQCTGTCTGTDADSSLVP